MITEIRLTKEEIATPYDFNYSLTHYNIYPWISEDELLKRVLRLKNDKLCVVEIQSIGTIDSPELIIKAKSILDLEPVEVTEIKETISWCLGLKEDYTQFYKLCKTDRVLLAALEGRYGSKSKTYPTIFEAIIGVICAQNIQFKRLYSMMYNLSSKFGEKITIDETDYFAFPTPEDISQASIEDLRACKVGYRDKYIKGIADIISRNRMNLDQLKNLPDEEIYKYLMQLPGVGPYTASLVLSVGLRKKNIFHLDSFVREAMYVFYFDNKKVADSEIIEFANNRWDGFQSLAVDALTTNTEIWAKKLGVNFKYRSGAKE